MPFAPRVYIIYRTCIDKFTEVRIAPSKALLQLYCNWFQDCFTSLFLCRSRLAVIESVELAIESSPRRSNRHPNDAVLTAKILQVVSILFQQTTLLIAPYGQSFPFSESALPLPHPREDRGGRTDSNDCKEDVSAHFRVRHGFRFFRGIADEEF